MERLRRRIAAIVADPDTAETLKPYYRFMCKRPCSSEEYLPAFNRPNVTLVDVSAAKGVDRLTGRGIVANGVEYEVDCVIFASGFEISTEISRRYAVETIEGRNGLSLFDHWRDNYQTLHGITSRGFPTSSSPDSSRAASRPTPPRCSNSRPATSPTSSARRSSGARRRSSRAARPRTTGWRGSGASRSTTPRSNYPARQAITTTRVGAAGMATPPSSATSIHPASTPSTSCWPTGGPG